MPLCFGGDWREGEYDDSPIGISSSMKEYILDMEYCEQKENQMSNEKFTQGEWDWFISGLESGYPIVSAGETDIAEIYLPQGNHEEMMANVSLIAAAPEMYRMLKYLADGIRFGGLQHTDRSLTAEIDELLKKARGENERA